jgi:hypothetical protein
LSNLSRDMKRIENLRKNRKPIVQKCIGCKNIIEELIEEYKGGRFYDGSFCSCYAHPESKWRVGVCPRATHVVREVSKEKISKKKRVGQQKQRKH